jgi:NADPH2:quinone reductase
MRAMVFDRYGEPDVMRLRDVPVPEPQDREVLIRVGYAGVNPADTKARAGHSARAGYRYREVDFPFVTGMDAAGASLTAFQALFHAEKGSMTPGQKVLINGAAGGVGSFAVQFAKSGGLLVSATCGTSNVAYVRSLGADRVIDYTTEDVGQAVRDWSAEGVDVVLDAVGPATLPHALEMLRPGGRLISILTVTADGDIEHDRKEAERRGFRKILSTIDFERARESMREITHLIDGGLVRVPAIDTLTLEDAARAHQLIDTGHVRGKLVLKVADI